MIKITIDVDADDALEMLAGMDRRAKDFRAVFNWARRELEKSNSENFTTGGLPVGGWVPGEEGTAWPLLRRTGKLFQSLANLRSAPNEVHRTHAYFGTKVEYAKFIQYGTDKMPARKIVFTPVGFAKAVGEQAAKHIIGLRAELLP